jgi:hypothetical protein
MKEPVGIDYEPLPWISYPAIDLLKDRLNRGMHLFEYGIGNSTLFYASRVASVTGVEHDINWIEKIKPYAPENVKIIYRPLEYGGEYSKAIVSESKKYDLIIVDGRDRVNCIKQSILAIKDTAVIILDDSQRENYAPGRKALAESGYKHIDFWGVSPGYLTRVCTTIFYKNSNCLGI